jgi:hypothetical protein
MLWHQQCEKLVEFKQENGHCVASQSCEQDKSLGQWVSDQPTFHDNNKMQLDRKEPPLDKLDFVWKVEGSRNVNDQLWLQHCEQLVEFKGNNGHCVVPWSCEQDSISPAHWIGIRKQRCSRSKDKIRLLQKTLLDKIGFAWKDKGAQKPHNHTH